MKAQGALRRLTLTGNRLQLAGQTVAGQNLSAAQYQGKVLLVVFWASYAQPFTDDLAALKATYAKHQKGGFEILGVNLDPDSSAVAPYLKKHGITWQSLRDAPKDEGQQPGDFGFGIVSVPTMFIVNKEGIVEGGITSANLDFAVDALIQGKKLQAIAPVEAGADQSSKSGNTTAEKPRSGPVQK